MPKRRLIQGDRPDYRLLGVYSLTPIENRIGRSAFGQKRETSAFCDLAYILKALIALLLPTRHWLAGVNLFRRRSCALKRRRYFANWQN